VPDEPPHHHRRTLVRVILVAEIVVALVTAATVVFAYNDLDGNLETLPDIPHVVEPPSADPEEPRTPLNVLVMGSDTREGEGNAIDGETGEGGSDTTILLHVSADRETTYGLSLARDTIVDRPDCEVDAKTVPGEDGAMFNEAFALGGPLCTVQQVEDLTGIYIDHTVVVDFNGFKDMVDAVHGVEVCIPKEVDDPAHGIHLDAGRQLLAGQDALNYVRERHVLSPNSDIGRMKRQQAFLASMVSRVFSANTLAMPNRLYQFLDAATRSIKLDKDLASLGRLFDLARQFQGADLGRIKFVTVPVETYPADINRLQFAPEAAGLWKVIRNDAPLGTYAKGSIAADDKVGDLGGDPNDPDAQERLANGLCA
jgi:LCP family protein required for cell wall assembly